jgi:hypothetical protein
MCIWDPVPTQPPFLQSASRIALNSYSNSSPVYHNIHVHIEPSLCVSSFSSHVDYSGAQSKIPIWLNWKVSPHDISITYCLRVPETSGVIIFQTLVRLSLGLQIHKKSVSKGWIGRRGILHEFEIFRKIHYLPSPAVMTWCTASWGLALPKRYFKVCKILEWLSSFERACRSNILYYSYCSTWWSKLSCSRRSWLAILIVVFVWSSCHIPRFYKSEILQSSLFLR